jgi:hypothetical protein
MNASDGRVTAFKTLKNGTFKHKKSLRLEAYALTFAVWTGQKY